MHVYESRTRVCAASDTHCSSGATDTRPCRGVFCGYWSEWSAYGACSITCGAYGTQVRRRKCKNHKSNDKEPHCQGDSVDTKPCHGDDYCQVDGGWSEWNGFGDCSKTCGPGGTRTRSRTCTRPLPTHGGRFCPGERMDRQQCYATHCPIDGGWTLWASYGPCSATCGVGLRKRTRKCANPRPANGGRYCEGVSSDTEPCKDRLCPVDGGWSPWTGYSKCSASCGEGTRLRTRSCSNLPPLRHDCVGKKRETKSCRENDFCPVDGDWSPWTDYGSCSVKCGTGTRSRTRSCSHPPPSYGGSSCPGEATDSKPCKEVHYCPVDGGWSHWSEYDGCSVTCGHGTQSRKRTCTNPNPQYGGQECPGKGADVRICQDQGCD
jgi:hypothetical protein